MPSSHPPPFPAANPYIIIVAGVGLDKQLDNNFLRTVPGTSIHKYAYSAYFQKMNWRKAVFIAQASAQDYDSYQSQVR